MGFKPKIIMFYFYSAAKIKHYGNIILIERRIYYKCDSKDKKNTSFQNGLSLLYQIGSGLPCRDSIGVRKQKHIPLGINCF